MTLQLGPRAKNRRLCAKGARSTSPLAAKRLPRRLRSSRRQATAFLFEARSEGGRGPPLRDRSPLPWRIRWTRCLATLGLDALPRLLDRDRLARAPSLSQEDGVLPISCCRRPSDERSLRIEHIQRGARPNAQQHRHGGCLIEPNEVFQAGNLDAPELPWLRMHTDEVREIPGLGCTRPTSDATGVQGRSCQAGECKKAR